MYAPETQLDLAHAHLRTRAESLWPRTQFSWQRGSEGIVCTWTDGPSVNSIGRVIHELPPSLRASIPAIRVQRKLGPAGWDRVVAAAEQRYSIAVPRTEAGAIDWRTASRRRLARTRTRTDNAPSAGTEVTYYNLAELLRQEVDRTDITHIT